MAEFTIKTGDASSCKDGDIVDAYNDRLIRYIHAQILCHVKNAGFTAEGLRPSDSLARMFREHTSEFRYDRLNKTEALQTTLATLAMVVLPMPGLQRHIDCLLGSNRRPVFGSPGREVFFDGKSNYSMAALTNVWNDIEAGTDYREADFQLAPTGCESLKKFLRIRVDDFTEQQRADYEAVDWDEERAIQEEDGRETILAIDGLEDPKFTELNLIPIKLRKRKRFVAWRDLPGLSGGTQTDVEKPAVDVDIREAVQFVHASIVQTKAKVA